jgi:ferrous iron transport protein B
MTPRRRLLRIAPGSPDDSDAPSSSNPVTANAAAPGCHADDSSATAGADAAVVALVGAPNVGKSTLFNALTGARRSVGNWPGTTVEVGSGVWRADDVERTLLDLPGAYSLDPASPDEALTRQLLVDVPVAERPDAVIVIVDAAHLARSLYLVAQLRETDARVVVALSMGDVAARRGLTVNTAALGAALGCPVVAVDPRRRSGLAPVAAAVTASLRAPAPAARCAADRAHLDEVALGDERFSWVETAVRAATVSGGTDRVTTSDRVDRIVTAPVLGPMIFLAAMWVVFQVTTTVAAPLQAALDALFAGPVTAAAVWALTRIGLADTWAQGFIVDGLIAGVGMLLTFVPLMALMFLLLALLEDSGYLARAAVVTDRTMRAIGLPGRAFLPFVVGYGCNVPAVAATRILPSARARVLTTLLIPFTSCSARLTVFVMLATMFFPAHAGTVVFSMYVASVLLLIVVGVALRSTLWRSMGREPLVLDLPPYQVPTLRLTLSEMWLRLKGFLRTASGIIVVTVAIVWLLQSVPVRGDGGFGSTPVEDSLYAATAEAVSPVFDPAGFGSWETTSTLAVGFVAK